MTTVSATPWARCFQPRRSATTRLFCFPFAGAGASAYRQWSDGLPAHVEVWSIQLPGREERLREQPYRSRSALLPALTDALTPLLQGGGRYAFFGHSLGSLLCYELTRELQKRGVRGPEQLFVSGRAAPHLPRAPAVGHLPHDEFIAELRTFKGTPEEILNEPELLEIFIPLLRADFALAELEPHEESPPLSLPITALGGVEDERASAAELDAWRELTTGRFARYMFPGHHFYLFDQRRPLLERITSLLG